MKQIIEKFGIEVSADTKDAKKNLDDTKKSTDDLEKSVEKLNRSASNTRKAFYNSNAGVLSNLSVVRKFRRALGLVGYTAAPIINSIVSSKAIKELNETSIALGVSVRELDAFGKSIESTGGSSLAFNESVKSISDGMDELKEKGEKSKLFPLFKELGVSAYDADGKLRNVFDVLKDIAGSFEKMDPRKSFTIGEKLGIDRNTIFFLQRGREEVEKLVKNQREFGTVTEESAERATRLTDSVSELKVSFRRLRENLSNETAPAIKYATDNLTKFFDLIAKNPETTVASIGLITSALAAWKFPILAATTALGFLIEDLLKGGQGIKIWSEEIGAFLTKNVTDKISFTSEAFGEVTLTNVLDKIDNAIYSGIDNLTYKNMEAPVELTESASKRLDYIKSIDLMKRTEDYAKPLSRGLYERPNEVSSNKEINLVMGDVTINTNATDAEEIAANFSDFYLKEMQKAVAAYDNGLK